DNIYANDASNKEDWIIVDLTQLPTPLTHGKYKARVINSSDAEIVSGFTHFQMVDISFSCEETTNPNGIATTFNSEEGTPYLIRQEKPDGMQTNASELTNSDVESGEKTLSWSSFSRSTSHDLACLLDLQKCGYFHVGIESFSSV
ncbi:MAG: hypothetical protein IIU48_07625, partial [Prevotella sp.]|nr:hypothetical protein [Prevotella sp.]